MKENTVTRAFYVIVLSAMIVGFAAGPGLRRSSMEAECRKNGGTPTWTQPSADYQRAGYGTPTFNCAQ